MTLSHKRILYRTNRFTKDIKALPQHIQREAFSVALLLTENIFHPEVDLRELSGMKGYYRAVVARVYRLIFSYDDDTMYLRRIGHRKDIYRKLEL